MSFGGNLFLFLVARAKKKKERNFELQGDALSVSSPAQAHSPGGAEMLRVVRPKERPSEVFRADDPSITVVVWACAKHTDE